MTKQRAPRKPRSVTFGWLPKKKRARLHGDYTAYQLEQIAIGLREIINGSKIK